VRELEDAASIGKGLGDISRAVFAHHLTAFDALAVEPGHGPTEEADCRGLLLVSEDLHIGEPCGVVDGHVDPVVTDACRTPLLMVAGNAVTHLAVGEAFCVAVACQLFDIDVDQVSWCLALVACTGGLGSRFRNRPRPRSVSHVALRPGNGD